MGQIMFALIAIKIIAWWIDAKNYIRNSLRQILLLRETLLNSSGGYTAVANNSIEPIPTYITKEEVHKIIQDLQT